METIVFNTTRKTVIVYEGVPQSSIISYQFNNISPVNPKEEGYYELIKKEVKGDNIMETSRPVARFPIANTVMFIEE
jgi:hypothetical protein